MKKYIQTLFLVFTTIIAFNAKVHAQTIWTLSQTVGNVDCYYRLTPCNADTVVFLKFVNRNNSSKTVSWKEVFDTQFAGGVIGFFGRRQMTLSPGTTEQSVCGDVLYPDCLILPSEVSAIYVAKIYRFSFADITVN